MLLLNTVQYKHTSQTLYVCYVEHCTIQTHISNTISMLFWIPYNMKGYEYKHKARKQYRPHSYGTILMQYWKSTSINTQLKQDTYDV